MKFKLKSMPSDFIVSESLILPQYFGNHRAQFNYYFLEKCGYSTFDAIERIASLLNINTTDIGYAGLKDEDGITTQHVSISASLTSGIDFQKINETLFEGDKFIQLRYLAKGNINALKESTTCRICFCNSYVERTLTELLNNGTLILFSYRGKEKCPGLDLSVINSDGLFLKKVFLMQIRGINLYTF